MRSRASGAARLDASFCCSCERAPALSELRLFPISFSCFYIWTFFGRATPDRAGARPYRAHTWIARGVIDPLAFPTLILRLNFPCKLVGSPRPCRFMPTAKNVKRQLPGNLPGLGRTAPVVRLAKPKFFREPSAFQRDE